MHRYPAAAVALRTAWPESDVLVVAIDRRRGKMFCLPITRERVEPEVT